MGANRSGRLQDARRSAEGLDTVSIGPNGQHGRMADWSAPDPLFVPEGRVVDLPGRGETFVRTHRGPPGSPTVLLLHGWTATADLNWFATYQGLAQRASLIAVDHRGHGRGLRTSRPFVLEAVADDAAAVLESLEAGPAIAVGYSMGGPIALHLAKRHPQLVSGLVLAGTSLSFNTTPLSALQWVSLPLFGIALRWDINRWLFRRLIDDVGGQDEMVAAWRDRLLGEAKRGTPSDLLEAGRALRHYDARPFAADLGLPASVVVTVGDRMVRPRRQRHMAEELAAPIVELQGDHDVFLRNGAAFAAAVCSAVENVAALQRATASGALRLTPRTAADRRSVLRRRRERRRLGKPSAGPRPGSRRQRLAARLPWRRRRLGADSAG
jgi:3-oxoadipate enol-lactonase